MSRKSKRNIGLFVITMFLVFVMSPAALFSAQPKEKAPKDIYLKGMKIKTNGEIKIPKGLMKKAYSKGEVGPYLVTFEGPIDNSMKLEVTKLGATLREYLPEFSFLTTMTPEVAEKVENLSSVENVMIYHPAFKINPSLKDDAGELKELGEVDVRIITFENNINLDNEIKQSNGKKLGHSKNKVTVKIKNKELKKFAHMNEVKYIEIAPEYVLFNDVAKNYMGMTEMEGIGYDGSGQVVAVCDTGLDTGKNDSSMHDDLEGRIDAIYALGRNTADDPHGHGTHVSGSVLGDGTKSNGQIKGTAPGAHLVMQSVLDSNGGLAGLPVDLNDLFAQAWNAGARIHTNSWGAPVGGEYNTNAQEVDEYVWNNDMIILFSAGNEGDGYYGTEYNSIGSPGTAKNCITVGASENDRPNMPDTRWGNVGDNVNEIAAFSSRGNCDDGRLKPDIVAPGTWILSTKSSLAPEGNFWEGYNNDYAYMGGTSMSTPLTAGAVAVARQYMQEVWNHTPSPAMMKAAIINGGVDMGFGYPSRDQGWGRLNIADSLVNKEYKYEDETHSLNTGESQSFNYSIESANTPLRVSLVWTDYPGSVTASKALVNDIDLKITSPSGTVYYGNDFTNPYNSGYDRLNNVENVWINVPEVGNYTVEVIGYNVPQGAQPYALFSSADFGTASTDTVPPTCNLTAPTNGETVNGTITLNATAADNEAVNRVEFYVDGNKVGTDSTDPYSFAWDTTTVNNGNHNIQAKAVDAAGNIGNSTTITVNVDNVVETTYETKNFSGKVRRNRSKTYYIDVTADGTIDLSLSSGTGLGMKLYSPSGTLLETGTTSISYDASVDGSYKIVVSSTSRKNVSFTLQATYPVVSN